MTRLSHSPTQINVQFSAPATPPGNYNVMVTSNGMTGVFLQAPGGGGGTSQAQSNSAHVGVACPVPSISSLTPDGILVSKSVQVTISGTNFTPNTTVNIGGVGVTASNILFENSSTVKAMIEVSTSATPSARTLTVSTCGGTSNGKSLSVRIPSRMVRVAYPGAPGGVGPLKVISPGNVVDLNDSILATDKCGVYRNYSFTVVDSNGNAIDIPFLLTEHFSSYSGPPGFPPPESLSFQLDDGEFIQDTQYFGKAWPSCLSPDDSETFDMTFVVRIGSTNFPLTTKIRIERGRFAGIYRVDSQIVLN